MATETALALSPAQRKRTVWRLDGGAGSDEPYAGSWRVIITCWRKGISNRRAVALARQVRRWDAYQDAWLGEVAPPTDYGRPVRVFVKRRRKNETFCYSSYLSTLALSAKSQFMAGYDDRGGAEVEQFRNDKSGLSLEARRKHSFVGQKGYILLTDLAHNLLADFQHRALSGTGFAGYGPKRIVRDLLTIPGRLIWQDGKLLRIELLSLNQNARPLALCLEKYCAGG